MPRRNSDFNTLLIKDPISNTTIGWYYRLPTSDERLQYKNKVISRGSAGVIVSENADEIMQDFAFDMIIGFRLGDFERRLDDGSYLAFSWKPEDENYYPEWRQWLRDNAMDLVTPLGIKLFIERPISVPEDIEGK
jgi:hypothetical protein